MLTAADADAADGAAPALSCSCCCQVVMTAAVAVNVVSSCCRRRHKLVVGYCWCSWPLLQSANAACCFYGRLLLLLQSGAVGPCRLLLQSARSKWATLDVSCCCVAVFCCLCYWLLLMQSVVNCCSRPNVTAAQVGAGLMTSLL